jgi:hypothetical protein
MQFPATQRADNLDANLFHNLDDKVVEENLSQPEDIK